MTPIIRISGISYPVMGVTKGRIMYVGRVRQICIVNAQWGQKYVAIYNEMMTKRKSIS